MQIKQKEHGRSMVEMLGVLAVIGVLTIAAVGGYRYAFNKYQANQVYKDIKLIQINLVSQTDGAPYEWEEFREELPSPYTYYVRRDKVQNNFVLIEAVEKNICIHLNRLAQDAGELTLYTMDNLPMDCLVDTQEVVVSFNGEEQLIPCVNNTECPNQEGIYCDEEEEICQRCGFDERLNDDENGCIDLCADRGDEKITSCKIETEKIGWCCRYDEFCSETKAGECVPSDGACIYTFFDADTNMGYKTDCSYYVGISEVMEKSETDCSYYVGVSDVMEKSETDCSYMVSDAGVVSSSVKCTNPKHYCALNWTKSSWNKGDPLPKASAGATGTLYGKCQMLTTHDTNPIVTFSEGTSLVYPKMGCGSSNKYCALNWTKSSWKKGDPLPKASAGATGTLYGKCQMLTTHDTNPIITFSEGASLVYPKMKCRNSTQYCALNWTKSSWEKGEAVPSAGAGASGVLYGKCQMLTTFNVTPYFEQITGTNRIFKAEKKCPPKMYCNLHWKDINCTAAGAGITGRVYGACALWDEKNKTCPKQTE